MHVVDGSLVVYMGGYSIAPKSLRAHKSFVFVKQQKLRKRKGVWKEKETEANNESSEDSRRFGGTKKQNKEVKLT